MNDFTKEELIEILEYCDVWQYYGAGMSDDRVNLWHKIDAMIVNYCEHECNGEVEIFVDTCKKCNAYLLRKTHHE